MRTSLPLLFIAFLAITLSSACDRMEAILFTDIEFPLNPVVVEEEEEPELFLRHSLGDIQTEDTTGTAFYSDDF